MAKHSIGFNKSSLKKCFSGESSLLIHAFKNDFIFIFDKFLFIFLCVCMLCGVHIPCCIYKWGINFLESVLSTHHSVTLSYLIGLAFTLMNEKTSPFIRSLMWGGSKGKKKDTYHSLTTLVQSQDPHGRRKNQLPQGVLTPTCRWCVTCTNSPLSHTINYVIEYKAHLICTLAFLWV